MTTNTTILILSLNNISAQLNRYFSIFIFIFGVFGNILNCLVLSQRTLRTNSCSFLFLISSIARLISLLSGLTTRMLSGWAVDLTETITWLCKLRAFVLFVTRNTTSWLITLASIDRWLSSSSNHQYRRKSSLKNAYRSVIVVFFFSIILYLQLFYCYESNQINTPLKCYGKSEMCRLTNYMSYAFLTILIPIILMVTFGLGTISNVRRVYRCVFVANIRLMNTTEQNQRSSQKKIDHHLLLMLLIQITLCCFFTLPQAIQKMYSTFTEQQMKSSLQNAIDNLIFNLALLLTYFSNGIPFYIYALCGGKIFRKILMDLF